jgi:hypothetical protein
MMRALEFEPSGGEKEIGEEREKESFVIVA